MVGAGLELPASVLLTAVLSSGIAEAFRTILSVNFTLSHKSEVLNKHSIQTLLFVGFHLIKVSFCRVLPSPCAFFPSFYNCVFSNPFIPKCLLFSPPSKPPLKCNCIAEFLSDIVNLDQILSSSLFVLFSLY